MTRLAVRPLDLTGPGSWRARADYFKAVELMRRVDRAQKAGESPAIDDVLGAFAARDRLILPRLYVLDGTPEDVEAELEIIAATEFDALAVQMLAGAEEDGAAVPTPSGTPSPTRSRSRRMLASAHPNGLSG